MTTIAEITKTVIDHRFELARLGQGSRATVLVSQRRARPIVAAIGTMQVNRITRSALEIYCAQRAAAGIAHTTVNQEMSFLQTVLRSAQADGVPVSLTSTPRLKVEAIEKPIPMANAVAKVLELLPAHHADAMRFMATTGISPHELERVAPCDISSQGLHIGQRGGFKVKVAARRRIVPLNKQAREIAVRAMTGRKPEEPMFPRRGATAKALSLVQAREGERISPKTMRSLFASMVAMTEPEHILQPLLGHSPGSPTTRRHYTRSNLASLGQAVSGIAL